MTFFVSRQHYWPTGERCVEVAAGGRDCANPDMLVIAYGRLGEGRDYDDPRHAVAAAIGICQTWRRESGKRSIDVRVGSTGGFTLPFEPGTFDKARAWAARQHEALPKCAVCGDLLGAGRYTHESGGDAEFCSERCAEADADALVAAEGGEPP